MIDLYCERITTGWWGEPYNVLTSAAYWAAAWGLWRLIARRPSATAVDRSLAILAAGVGCGSVAFHALATPWARLLDEGPILAFQLVFMAGYGRRALGLSRTAASVIVAVFVALVIGLRAGAAGAANGTLPYAPALVVALAIGIDRAARVNRIDLLVAAFVFVAAVACRAADNAMCAAWPHGTHFIWHLLTAIVLYRFAAALIVGGKT